VLNRIIGVFKLDTKTFEEIEHNTGLTVTAGIIVVIIALITGLGAGISNAIFSRSFFGGFLSTLIGSIIGWFLWSAVTWFIGTRLFGGQADISEMLRVIGFAYIPMVLFIVPCVGPIVGAIWTLVAGFIAVRQGLDLDNTKTFFTVVIGAICYLILTVILNLIIHI
jgi:hypothetical protein